VGIVTAYKSGDGYRLNGAADSPLIPPTRQQITAAAGTILAHADGDAEARDLVAMLVDPGWWVE
jgi:hypothetical protein